MNSLDELRFTVTAKNRELLLDEARKVAESYFGGTPYCIEHTSSARVSDDTDNDPPLADEPYPLFEAEFYVKRDEEYAF